MMQLLDMTDNLPSCKVLLTVFLVWMCFLPVTVAGQDILDAGSDCGCPEVPLRDTVWVNDANGGGVGTTTWSCDHVYVLTEQVFVNAGDTLFIEPGTAILGTQGEGRSVIEVPANNEVGMVRYVT